MYSLPIANYLDYWRTAKNRSFTVGGTLLLAGSALVYTPVAIPTELPDWKNPIAEPLDQDLVSAPSQEVSEVPPESALPDQTTKVLVNYRIEDVQIPVTTEYVESRQIAPGMSQIKEQGEKGLERRVIRTTLVNGEIRDEQIVHKFYLNEPKKRVVIRNTQPVKGESFDLSQFNVKKTFTVEATAYTYTGNRTATGIYPREGIIAVDPRVIPLGTQVYVEGYGYAIAADTGGAIKGNIIDVFFPSLQRCLEWGRRPVQIYILDGK